MIIEQEIIKMLAKAKEIQKRREFTVGNIYYNAYRGALEIIGLRIGNNKIFNSFNYPLRDNKKEYVWIPSQMQLQTIYYKECHENFFKENQYDLNKLELTIVSLDAIKVFVELMAKFNIFFVNHYEIWIAFVMYELYNKVWVFDSWRLFKYTKPPQDKKRKKKK